MPFVQGTENLRGLDLSFEANPNTGDVPVLSRFSVIRQSLANVLTLGILDKPFREDIGSELKQLLFNVASVADIPPIKARIRNTIERLETRVVVNNVDIQANFEKNFLDVTVVYTIKKTQEQDEFTTTLTLSE